MTVNEHEKYLIDKILTSKDPIDNLNVLIHNANLSKESLDYVRSNALSLGYELRGYNCGDHLSNYCGSVPGYCRCTPSPCTGPCRSSWGGCDFIPLKKEKVDKHASSRK